jgi:hypothetical protein
MGKFVLKHPAGDNTQYGHAKTSFRLFLIPASKKTSVLRLLITHSTHENAFMMVNHHIVDFHRERKHELQSKFLGYN